MTKKLMNFSRRGWALRFQVYFPRHLTALFEVLEQRLLPVFEKINDEYFEKLDSKWKQVNSDSSLEDVPVSLNHDEMMDLGRYHAMLNIRQSLLNIYTIALYHAWEQQLFEFHRQELLYVNEQDNNSLINQYVFRQRLKKNAGVDIKLLPSWEKIVELRLLANTVKHADGDSADQLKVLRPDLFTPSIIAKIGLTPLTAPEIFRVIIPDLYRVYTPLSGNDIYVPLDDLKDYCSAVSSFWLEFSNVLGLPNYLSKGGGGLIVIRPIQADR